MNRTVRCTCVCHDRCNASFNYLLLNAFFFSRLFNLSFFFHSRAFGFHIYLIWSMCQFLFVCLCECFDFDDDFHQICFHFYSWWPYLELNREQLVYRKRSKWRAQRKFELNFKYCVTVIFFQGITKRILILMMI